MPDFYGSLEIPVPVPVGGATVADPLVDVLLSFFTTILNANAEAAWAAVSGYQPGGNGDVVVETFAWNPEEEGGTAFNSRDLPALFMWREEIGGSEWLAADYYVRPSKLQLLWVPPLTVEENRTVFRPFINAIASIIDGITDPDGRDPSYKVAGDPDPAASYLGSLLWKQTPNLYSFDVGKTKPSTIRLATDSGERPHYPCVRMEIAIRERNTVGEPPDDYFELIGADMTISDAAGGPEPGPDDITISPGAPFTGSIGVPDALPGLIVPGTP
jgi:hypothetical protein